MNTEIKEISFLHPLQSAIALCDSFPLIVCKTKEDYDAAEAKRKQARLFLEKLDLEYKTNETVIQAKDIQRQKLELEERLKAFNKNVKAGPMLAYEQAEAKARAAEEARQSAILKAKADAEAAAEGKKQAELAKKAEAEAKRLAKKGDEEAAEQARIKAETARAEQERIKAEAKAAPAPTVVLEAPKTVSRRTVYGYTLTAKDGRQFRKEDMKASVRLGIADLGPLPAHLFVLSPVLLNEFVDSQGESASIPGVLEVKGSQV
jgi:hypothetical protein